MQPLSYVAAYGGTGGNGDRWRYQAEDVPRLVVVIHTSEQADDLDQLNDAEQLMSALSRPGTSGTPPRQWGSCYHAITDVKAGPNGGLVAAGYHQIAPWHARVNAAPPLNEEALHVCMPEQVADSRATWLASGHVEAAAMFVRDAMATYGIHAVKLAPATMAPHLSDGRYTGPTGYCGHVDVTNAWHQTTHTDPGKNFPWDHLADLVVDGPDPTPPPDWPLVEGALAMTVPVLLKTKLYPDNASDFVLAFGGAVWGFANNQALTDTLREANPKLVEQQISRGAMRAIFNSLAVGMIMDDAHAPPPKKDAG